MTDAKYFNDIAHCMRLGDGNGAINVIARIRAEARAEALRIAEKQIREWFAYVSYDYDHDAPEWAHKLAAEQEAERAALAEKGE